LVCNVKAWSTPVDGRWRRSHRSLLGGIVLHDILARLSLAFRIWASGDGVCALGVFVVQQAMLLFSL
jgi:hypothetical protein